MARTPQDVTDAELAILQELWDQGPANRRQLTDRLYPGGGPAHYTTVQKLLERLATKGYVTLRRGSSPVIFEAAISRDELISRRLQVVAEKLCEGSMTPLLMSLVRAGRLSDKDLQALHVFIDDLRKQAKTKGTRR
jgi:predicted transcriptional regulator